MADYIAIILRAIEKAQDDPNQLRQLVYDISRISLGSQLLLNYREVGSEGLQQQLSNLESAIRQVETLARLESELLPSNRPIALVDRSTTVQDEIAALVSYRVGQPGVDRNRQHLTNLSPNYALPSAGPRLRSDPDWDPRNVPKGKSADRFRKFELPIAVILGFAIYALTLVRSDYFPMPRILGHEQITRSRAAPLPAALPASSASAASKVAIIANHQQSDFPLPSVYGVYAVSEGHLYELEPIAMRVPDPRVAVSAMLSSMSRTIVPKDGIKFVIYRRDLIASAPDTVSIRVVAQVMREIKFAASGPPHTINVDGQWAIRNKSYDFEVAPLKSNPEMIIARSTDPNFAFPSGRYVLVFKGEGYDFNIAGRVTDTAHCLERTDALGGMVYSECRRLP
jgi:hypothetical protein